VWDIKQRGLAVQVHPSGRSAWKFIYSRHGRPRWFHIGRTDVVGLADARKLAAMMTVQVHAGGNPQGGIMKSREQQIAEKWKAFASSGTVASFLYRHYNSDGDLLYVGVTNHVVTRTSRHFQKASWAAEIFKIVIEPFETREASLSAEVVAVKTEYPQHNRTWNGDRDNPLAAVAEGAWK
jgi:hypothetical protein